MAVGKENYVYLKSFFKKLRGMLARRIDARTYVLCGCSSIHTCGMIKPIDVAFVSVEGEVLEVKRKVKPFAFLKNTKAYFVIERFSSDEEWFCAGEVISELKGF